MFMRIIMKTIKDEDSCSCASCNWKTRLPACLSLVFPLCCNQHQAASGITDMRYYVEYGKKYRNTERFVNFSNVFPLCCVTNIRQHRYQILQYWKKKQKKKYRNKLGFANIFVVLRFDVTNFRQHRYTEILKAKEIRIYRKTCHFITGVVPLL